jgi:hypothetical protein
MFAENLDQILERWKEAFRQYSELKAETERSVVRWEWTTGERYSLLPFHFERFPGRGRVISEPPSLGAYLCYGFDDQGRVRLQRSYFRRGSAGQGIFQKIFNHPNDLYSETFYRSTGPQVELIEYSAAPQIPLKVEQILISNGRVELYTRFNLNGYTPLYSQKGKDPEALYAFVSGGEVVYVGREREAFGGSIDAGGPLGMVRRHTTDNDRRIIETLMGGREIEIRALASSEPVTYRGWRLNIGAGLQDALVRRVQPAWNRGGPRARTPF